MGPQCPCSSLRPRAQPRPPAGSAAGGQRPVGSARPGAGALELCSRAQRSQGGLSPRGTEFEMPEPEADVSALVPSGPALGAALCCVGFLSGFLLEDCSCQKQYADPCAFALFPHG